MRDANAEEAFLVIVEGDGSEGLERDDHVDRSCSVAINGKFGKDVVSGLGEEGLRVVCGGVPGNPCGPRNEFSGAAAAARGDDFVVRDGAVLMAVGGLDGVRVVPEIEAVGVAIVEPEARVVRV